MNLLALLATVLIQESATEFLKKVEEKYAAAKTFSVKVELTTVSLVQGKEVVLARATGAFQSKGDGKARLQWSMSVGGMKVPALTVVSNGRQMAVLDEGQAKRKKDHAVPLGLWTRRFLVRAGLLSAVNSIYGPVFDKADLKLDVLYKVGDVSDGGKEKVGDVECRLIDFTVSAAPPEKPPMKVRLWIDPATLIVLKREMGADNTTIRETMNDTTFDAEIADDAFKVWW